MALDASSSDFFTHLVSAIGDGVIAVDTDGIVTHLNPIAVELTGWLLEEALGEHISTVFPIINEESRKPVANPALQVLESGSPTELANHTLLVCRDGSEVPIDDSGSPITDESGSVTGAVIVFRSIAERRAIEIEREEVQKLTQLHGEVGNAVAESSSQSEMLHRICWAIVEHLGASFARVWTLDTSGKRLDLRASAGSEESLDDAHATIAIGDNTIGKIAADASSYYTNEIDGSSPSDIRSGVGSGMVAFAGYPLVADDRLIGVVAVFAKHSLSDHGFDALEAISKITANGIVRHLISIENQKLDLRYEAMIRQISDYAVFMTDADGVATTWNQGVESVLGFKQEEFIGLPVKKTIFTEDAISNGVPEWEFSTAVSSGSCTDDRWMRKQDGSTFWASGITTSVTDENGRVIGFSKVLRDLTHRKDAEDAIKQLNAELSEADRRKTHFLATLAHELRNPLSPITSALALMRDDAIDNAELATLREMVERQVEQMVHLVDDLLDLSRISRGKIDLRRTKCRLQPIIRQAIESVQPFIAESSHVLKTDIPDQRITLHGDAVRLAQVFTNLLNNAAKYTPLDGKICLSIEVKGEAVEITISDNGIGIENHKIGSIFDMFSQADVSLERGKAGLGIGLALVKTLVEMHEGSIQLESGGRNEGTTVTVTLPIIPDSPVDRQSDLLELERQRVQAAEESESSAEAPTTATIRRVLVVDDMHAITFTLSRLIGKLGHTVETAGSAREAIDKIPTFAPDVVISDISMPEMNGYELAAECRTRFDDRNLVLVAMTGFGHDADKVRALEAGFDHHMIKPPDARVLASFFRELDKE